jgi:cob(I)alamin adenosyltransferase
MVRITKLTTKTGDDGTTGLGDGSRVPKHAARIEAYGEVDELNAAIGLVVCGDVSGSLAAVLARIQNELFHLGSELCFPPETGEQRAVPRIEGRHVDVLETDMATLGCDLAPLENFILPGGCEASARLHLARCVCRRAERRVVELAMTESVGDHSVRYLNRLSDLLYVLARVENARAGVPDVTWDSRA